MEDSIKQMILDEVNDAYLEGFHYAITNHKDFIQQGYTKEQYLEIIKQKLKSIRNSVDDFTLNRYKY